MFYREKEKLLTTQRECVAQQKRGDDALAALEESRLQAQLLRETNSRSELALKEKEQVCGALFIYRLFHQGERSWMLFSIMIIIDHRTMSMNTYHSKSISFIGHILEVFASIESTAEYGCASIVKCQ